MSRWWRPTCPADTRRVQQPSTRPASSSPRPHRSPVAWATSQATSSPAAGATAAAGRGAAGVAAQPPRHRPRRLRPPDGGAAPGHRGPPPATGTGLEAEWRGAATLTPTCGPPTDNIPPSRLIAAPSHLLAHAAGSGRRTAGSRLPSCAGAIHSSGTPLEVIHAVVTLISHQLVGHVAVEARREERPLVLVVPPCRRQQPRGLV